MSSLKDSAKDVANAIKELSIRVHELALSIRNLESYLHVYDTAKSDTHGAIMDNMILAHQLGDALAQIDQLKDGERLSTLKPDSNGLTKHQSGWTK